jgi:hypothetical protein
MDNNIHTSCSYYIIFHIKGFLIVQVTEALKKRKNFGSFFAPLRLLIFLCIKKKIARPSFVKAPSGFILTQRKCRRRKGAKGKAKILFYSFIPNVEHVPVPTS